LVGCPDKTEQLQPQLETAAPTGDDETFGGVAEVVEPPPDIKGIEETGQPDAGAAFTELCSDNADCESGFCLWHQGDKVCSESCVDSCPAGWSCNQVSLGGPDLTFACVSLHPTLCLPCTTDDDCSTTVGDPSSCLGYGEAGSFCGTACDAVTPCPDDYLCTEGLCRPAAGACGCTETAAELGLATTCSASNEAGTCLGERVCTADGLTPCDAAAAAEDVCDGVDNDCDGATDSVPCDDGDPCTTDSCAADEGCQHIGGDGSPCDDGDVCTDQDLCAVGVCSGQTVVCDDADPCTADSCVPTVGCVGVETGACECAVDADCPQPTDKCAGVRVCVSTDEKPYPHCEIEPGSPIECDAPTGVDAACLAAICDAETGTCSEAAANEGGACDLGIACTFKDACAAGQCIAGAPVSCDDGNPCTEDSCTDATGCQHVPNTAVCNDADPCTTADQCTGGQCKGAVVDCNDSDPCTTDSCGADGCAYAPANLSCDDNNVCTSDTCVAGIGCQHAPAANKCDDGSACTSDDVCADGGCAGTPVDCDDDDACTADTCDTVAGCINVGGNVVCDDGNPCTDDACEAAPGCVFTPNSAACDDLSACTGQDTCTAGWCIGAPVDCDDGDQCSIDTCDAALGCQNDPAQTGACEDGNLCTAGDTCHDGQCQGGGPPLCADTDACTADSCDPAQGCVFTKIADCCGNKLVEDGEVCDDGAQENGDGCSADCKSLEECGNSILDVGEVCDAPKFGMECAKGFFGCADECQTLDTSTCFSWCGDGKLDLGNEDCDGDMYPLECWEGSFTCKLGCKIWDKSDCSAYCGDGIQNGPEQCDGADLPVEQCPVGACECSNDCTIKAVAASTEVDWDSGVKEGTGTQPAVLLDAECGNPDTLCLDASTYTLSHIWVANSNHHEIVRINVDTGEVELEIPSAGQNPSRTAVVAKDGSVWVGNRGWNCSSDPNCSNAVHFALDGSFICRVDIPGMVRSLAIDMNGHVWANSWEGYKAYKISGTEVDTTKSPVRCKVLATVDVAGRSYGAVGDADGNIWMAHNSNWASSYDKSVQSLQQVDAVKNEVVGTYAPEPSLSGCYQNYGITLDGQGRIVIGSYACNGVFRYTPETNGWEWRHVPEGTPRGTVVDAKGYIYSALSCTNVGCGAHLRHIVRVTPDFKSHTVLDMGPGIEHPVGAALDHNGMLWTAGRNSDTAARVDIANWDKAPTIDIYPTNGDDPYSYSDMTGFQFLMYTNPEGTWDKVVDGGLGDVTWKVVEWVGIEEAGVTDIKLRVRSAPSKPALEVTPWTDYETDSPMDLQALITEHHRYLQVQVHMQSSSGDKTPVLQSMVVHWKTI